MTNCETFLESVIDSPSVITKVPTGIVKFSGFEDDEYEADDTQIQLQTFGDNNGVVEEMKTAKEKKRRRGGRKQRQRMNAFAKQLMSLTSEKKDDTVEEQKVVTKSRLMQELHDRERVRGMDRIEARQLLQDKLLFCGETDLAEIRLRRFCIVMVSSEQLFLSEISQIPLEVLSISVENGRISSILRLVPTLHDKPPELESSDKTLRYRMKTIFWNPCRVKDVNTMYKMWNHFLDRCLHSLLLVPLSQNQQVLAWLRKMNDLRSILNNRPTSSICLSRVITIEDFLISIQQLSEAYTNLEPASEKKHSSLLDQCLDLCSYFIESMRSIERTFVAMIKNTDLREKGAWEVNQNPFDAYKYVPPAGFRGDVGICHLTPQSNFARNQSNSFYAMCADYEPFSNQNMEYLRNPGFATYSSPSKLAPSFVPFNTSPFNTPPSNYCPSLPHQSFTETNGFLEFVNAPFLNTKSNFKPGDVQLYLRIFEWVESIDLKNMNKSEELEDIFPAGAPIIDDGDISDFEYNE